MLPFKSSIIIFITKWMPGIIFSPSRFVTLVIANLIKNAAGFWINPGNGIKSVNFSTPSPKRFFKLFL